jgi:F-type H+-transporting ATPase subunit delta
LSISAITKRYAKALVHIGAEQQAVEQYGQELANVSYVFASEERLRLLLESPTFPLEKKSTMLAELCEVLQLSPGMRNFLGLLLHKDRLKYLGQISIDYRALADELSGTVRAQITAAAELDAAQREAIRVGLEKQTGKTVELRVQVDPSLIGGLQASLGGKVFDGSVKTQLKRIADTLNKG